MQRPIAFTAALALAAAPSAALGQQTTVTEAKKGPSHPPEVALVEEGDKGSVYRTFPTSLRLYVSKRDPLNASACYRGCVGPWIPVYAPRGSKAVGEWQVLRRRDGRMQWMLKGKPIYTRFHDSPDVPTGDGIDGVWQIVPHTPAAANPPAKDLTQ